MKKRKVALAITALVALIVLLITGYTFSKFNQSYSGKATMKSANWFFNVTTNNNNPISEITLNSADGTPLVSGSSGSFEINVDATGSEVGIHYYTVITEENLPESMVFYMQGKESSRYERLKELLENEVQGNLTVGETQKVTHTVCWEWPINGSDTIDSSSNMNYGFNIKVIGEQI